VRRYRSPPVISHTSPISRGVLTFLYIILPPRSAYHITRKTTWTNNIPFVVKFWYATYTPCFRYATQQHIACTSLHNLKLRLYNKVKLRLPVWSSACYLLFRQAWSAYASGSMYPSCLYTAMHEPQDPIVSVRSPCSATYMLLRI
jgi:hypothetical protein